MKKVLLVLMALVVIGIAGEMFLVENYIEGEVECPLHEQEMLKVTFTLPCATYVTFSYGFDVVGWLEIDGTKVPISMFKGRSSLHYKFEDEDIGEHIVGFWCNGGEGVKGRNPLLQVLILQLPDSNNYVSERPSEEDEVQVSSVLTVGPMVRVPGCQAVVDATGRTVDCVIEGDQVSVNSLPIGTYFAAGSNGRTTKIVKLK